MLNFTERKQKLWEVVLKDGQHLEVSLPDGAFYEELTSMHNVKTMLDIEQMVADILNRNKQERIFTVEEISQTFDVSELQAIIIDYRVTTEQAINDPN